MSKKLRIGVIGAGGIATAAHIPGYQQLLDRVELVAIADVNGERARQVAQEKGFQKSYSDYEKMFAECELDAVSVCTPNKFHAPAAIAASRAGCHVLCEKPPAMNVQEAEAMVQAAQQAGKILTFGLHYRYTSEVRACKRFVDGGELGEIYAVRVNALRRRGIPGWGVFTNKELQGGGPIIDIGVHMLDTALYLMGYPKPIQVLGTTYQKIGTRPGVGTMGQWDWQNYQVEDLAMGMIKFDNGATMLLEASFAANVESLDEMNVRLMGTEGGARVFPLKVFKEMYGALVDLTSAWLPQEQHPHWAEVREFVDACISGGEGMVKGVEAIRLQQIIDGLYKSAETGDLVKLG